MLASVEAEKREDLAALIKRAMDETGMSQSEMAEHSGIPLATLNAWITGRRIPGNTPRAKEQLRALAGVLPGITVKDLFEAIGQRVPGPLSPDAERRVLERYRSLSPGRQRVVDQLLDTLAAEERPKVEG